MVASSGCYNRKTRIHSVMCLSTSAMKKQSPPLPFLAVSAAEDRQRTRQSQQATASRAFVSFQEWVEAHNLTLPTSCTLLELVQTVNSHTASDVETVAVVTYLINSGRVRLRGTFAGAKISFAQTHRRRN